MATTSFQHSSYFVSARTGDLINACFLKVTADLLGIRLSGAELDKTTVSFTPLHPVIGGRERSWGRGVEKIVTCSQQKSRYWMHR